VRAISDRTQRGDVADSPLRNKSHEFALAVVRQVKELRALITYNLSLCSGIWIARSANRNLTLIT
jgi:hypothetical protein